MFRRSSLVKMRAQWRGTTLSLTAGDGIQSDLVTRVHQIYQLDALDQLDALKLAGWEQGAGEQVDGAVVRAVGGKSAAAWRSLEKTLLMSW